MKHWIAAAAFAIVSGPVLAGGSVVIPSEAPYANEQAVDAAVRTECALPKRTIDLLSSAMNAAGIEPRIVAQATPKSGDKVLLLNIDSVTQRGNAMMGRIKVVTVSGKLYENGKPVASFVATRGSGGGAFGGWKGSCAIMGRCVEAIGRDVAHWLASPVDGAKLGDAR